MTQHQALTKYEAPSTNREQRRRQRADGQRRVADLRGAHARRPLECRAYRSSPLCEGEALLSQVRRMCDRCGWAGTEDQCADSRPTWLADLERGIQEHQSAQREARPYSRCATWVNDNRQEERLRRKNRRRVKMSWRSGAARGGLHVPAREATVSRRAGRGRARTFARIIRRVMVELA